MNVLKIAKACNYKKLMLSATYTKLHQDKGIEYEDLVNYFNNLGVQATITKVLTDNPKYKIPHEVTRELLINDIQNSFEKMLNNDFSSTINVFVNYFLQSLAFGTRTQSFCDDLDKNNSRCYEYNCELYNCFRLWGDSSYIVDDSKLVNDKVAKENNKNNHHLCSKCWAKNLCKLCIVAVMQNQLSFPFDDKQCKQKNAYELVVYSFLRHIVNGSAEKIVHNFVDNFFIY